MLRVKVALFLLVQASAFAPFSPIHLSPSSTESTTTSTQLHGLRSFLRRKFSRGGSNNDNEKDKIWDGQLDESAPAPILEDADGIGLASDDSTMSLSSAEDALNMSLQRQSKLATSTTTTTTSKDSTTALEEQDDEEHPLPPRDAAQLTKFETEFRDMLYDFSKYTRRDIAHVKNARLRALYEGIAASYYIPEVYRAFEILFEDYAPLRVGGRLVYAQLKQSMMEAQLERKEEVESVSQVTGLDPVEIEKNRIAWLKMAVHHEDDKAAQLTMQQLIDFGLAETVGEVLGHEDFEGWLNSLNQNSTTDGLTFCELMLALQNCSVDSDQPECNPHTLLPELVRRLEPEEMTINVKSLSDKKKRYSNRYDGMVESFLQWKDNFPAESKSRNMDVLRGCYAGAQNPDIVKALRIVYLDFTALRFAGDLIFKVMKTLVGSRKKTVPR